MKDANKLPESNRFESISRREEVRGLFTLGILAVLLGYRITNAELVIQYGSTKWDITWFIDFTIILWVLYGICMIFAFSDDLYGEEFSKLLRSIGTTFMSFSLAMFMIVIVVFSANVYPNRTNLFMLLITYTVFGILGLGAINSINNFLKSKTSLQINLKKRYNNIKKNISNITSALLIIDLILISYIPPSYDKYINILSMIGFALLAIFLGSNIIIIIYSNNGKK